MVRSSMSASHCFAFEQDFIGTWRCIPLCVRRKLDLVGVKLKLSHWLALSQRQRQRPCGLAGYAAEASRTSCGTICEASARDRWQMAWPEDLPPANGCALAAAGTALPPCGAAAPLRTEGAWT